MQTIRHHQPLQALTTLNTNRVDTLLTTLHDSQQLRVQVQQNFHQNVAILMEGNKEEMDRHLHEAADKMEYLGHFIQDGLSRASQAFEALTTHVNEQSERARLAYAQLQD